jgi:hypothetical protein
VNKIAGTKGHIEHKEVVKSATNIECIPATEKADGSQLSKKSHCETKGDMQQCGGFADRRTYKIFKSLPAITHCQ